MTDSFVMLVEARSPESRCGQDCAPTEAPGENPASPLSAAGSSGCWWPRLLVAPATRWLEATRP